jgi:hypothetical protein
VKEEGTDGGMVDGEEGSGREDDGRREKGKGGGSVRSLQFCEASVRASHVSKWVIRNHIHHI